MSFSEILLAKASEANKKFNLFSDGERILVGFSGGADSLALVCVLQDTHMCEVHAFHVNHMLRGEEADADENFCRSFCEKRGIPFSSVRLNVAEASNGSAVEETARNMRYQALAEECERIGAKKIALAHTASDNIETVLFNLSRGTGLSGLRGIPPKRMHGDCEIIRPLILCTRTEIEGYADENGLPYCTDATNSDVHYRRNYIRHKIVPLMKELNPSLEERISITSSSLRDDEEFISEYAKKFIDENLVGEGISSEKLLGLHKAVRVRVFFAMYLRVGKEHLEEKHFSDIERLLLNEKNVARIILPGKIAAVMKNGYLYFVHDEKFTDENRKREFSQVISEGVSNLDGKFSIALFKINEKEKFKDADANAAFSSKAYLSESVARSIYVRNRENGDKYYFGGMTRSLKKLLNGKDLKAKNVRPVFCDEKGIFWFPGFRLRDDVYKDDEEKTYILYYIEY